MSCKSKPTTKFKAALRSLQDELENAKKFISDNDDSYNTLTNNLKLGLFKIKPDGTIIFANDYTVKSLEFGSLEELKGTNAILRFKSKRDKYKIIKEVLSKTQIVNFETEIITKTGKTINVLLSARKIGDVIHGMALNTSSLKKLNDEIENYQSVIDSTLDSTADGILVIDTDGKVIRYNNKFLSMWKIPDKVASLKKSCVLHNYMRKQLCYPEDFDKKIEQLKNNPEKENFEILYFNDGRVLERYSKPQFKNNEIIGRVWSFRDITDKVNTDKQLSENILKYKTLFDSANDAIFLIEGDSIIDCNPRAEELFECPRENILGKNLLDFSPERQPDGRVSKKILSKLFKRADNGEHVTFEWRHFQCSGKPVDAEINLNLVYLQGRIVIQAIVKNISQKKKDETLQNAIYKISVAANRVKDLKQLYVEFHKIIDELVVANNFYIALCDPVKNMISFPYFVDEYDEQPEPRKAGRGLTEYVLRNEEAILVTPERFEQLLENGNVEEILTKPVDWLGVPLKISGKTIGVLVVQSYSEKVRYGEEDKDFLCYVSNQVAMAIERKQFEQKLQFTQFAIDHAGEAAFWMDKEGKFIYINNAASEMLNYTHHELLSMKISDIAPHITQGKWEEQWHKIKEKKHLTYESVFLDRHSDIIPVEVTTDHVKFEGKEYNITFAHDISERKKSQESLLKLKKAVENSGDVIFMTNPYGTFTYVNPRFTALYGHTAEEVIGKETPVILRSELNDKKKYKEYWEAIFKRETVREELFNKSKTGKIINIESLVSPIIGEENELLGFLAIQTDITQRKMAEKELLKAKEKAEEMNRLKTNFLANMSHELRTPLVGVLGFTEMLKDELNEHEQISMADEIIVSTNRLMTTLDSILDFSRIESEQIKINPEPLNVIEIIESKLNHFKIAAGEKGLKLIFDKRYSLIDANFDEAILDKILHNLISNAIKYTKEGSVSVIAEAFESEGENYVRIKVTDTGIGIPGNYLKEIFEEFRQVSEGFDRNFEGAGLGLTVTKNFVDLLGGTIEVKSEPGTGSEFNVTFPATGKVVEATGNDNYREQNHLKQPYIINENGRNKILMLEDDETSREIALISLCEKCDITFAGSGEEFFQLLNVKDYDVLLIDTTVESVSGSKELVKKIREIDRYSGTPVVSIVPYKMQNGKDEFLKAGFTHFLTRPFNRFSIEELMKDILNIEVE